MNLSQLRQNKMLLFQLAALSTAIIVAITVIILLLTSPEETKTPPATNVSPTLISQSVTTIPRNGAVDVGIFDSITITFPKALTSQQQHAISITAIPPILTDRVWQKDNKTLVITPQTALKENQQYTLLIRSPFPSYTLSFTTATEEQAEEKQIRESGLTTTEVNKLYPWYNKLPLFTGKYFVTFDLTKKQFDAKLYPTKPAQVDVLKSTIISHLQAMGVDTTAYKINWQISNP